MNEEELLKKLDDIDKRVSNIEKLLFGKKEAFAVKEERRIEQSMDLISNAQNISKNLPRKEIFIKLLEWASKKHPKRGLTPSEIAKYYNYKFKKTVKPGNVASWLKSDLGNIDKVSRKLEGKTFRWYVEK